MAMRDIDIGKLLEIAGDRSVALEEGLLSVARLMQDNYELGVFFEDQAITPEHKKKMLADLFPGADPLLSGLIGLLIDQGLEQRLGQLSEELTKAVSEKQGITFADVTTPYLLTDGERRRIEEFVGDKVRLRIEIDPTLIGGIRIMTSDGRLLDGSLKGTIERLKEELIHA